MGKDKSNDKSKDGTQDDESLLGSATTPEAQQLPTTNGAENTAPVPTTEAGSATHLNAYRQDVEDQRSKVIGAVNEAFDRAGAAVEEAQRRLAQ